MFNNKNKNKVINFFEAWAELKGISLNYKWKSELVEKIGSSINLSSSNLIGNWKGRGFIPDQTIENILKLDIPESLKNLCKDCKKTPPESSSASSGSMFSDSGIEICGYKFRNRKIALKYVKIMWHIEQLDGDLFNHELKCLKRALDAADIIVKKIKNQS